MSTATVPPPAQVASRGSTEQKIVNLIDKSLETTDPISIDRKTEIELVVQAMGSFQKQVFTSTVSLQFLASKSIYFERWIKEHETKREPIPSTHVLEIGSALGWADRPGAHLLWWLTGKPVAGYFGGQSYASQPKEFTKNISDLNVWDLARLLHLACHYLVFSLIDEIQRVIKEKKPNVFSYEDLLRFLKVLSNHKRVIVCDELEALVRELLVKHHTQSLIDFAVNMTRV